MRNLNYQLKQLCQRNRDGSFTTQADRERILYLVANQLVEMGFRQMSADSLRPKHVEALVARWKSEAIGTGTFKNRMSALRWWAEKIGKENVVARKNSAYAIENRVLVTNRSKAKTVSATCMGLVTDTYTAISLRLQSAFGLRREESIKIIPAWADQGDRLRLKDSWAKGGRYRELPISTAEQRAALDAAKNLTQGGSLIPVPMRYRDQLQRFKAQCAKAGINGAHGLRHQYAQSRYEELTGWKCPAAGGPTSKQLTTSQKARNRAARLTISAELGHRREQVTAIYLGR
jgi:integrase